MRMLDNVIDINFYPTKEAANSNLKHRPVGAEVWVGRCISFLQS